jgi:hypothetical protein
MQKEIQIIAKESEKTEDLAESQNDVDAEAPPAKVPMNEEKGVTEPAVVANENINSTISNSDGGVTLNTVTPTNSFSWTPSQGVTSQGATPNLTSPTVNFDSESTLSLKSSKYQNDSKKLEKALSKSKAKKNADSPASLEKREAFKASEETAASSGKESADDVVDLLQEAKQLFINKQFDAALLDFNQYLKSNPSNCDAIKGAAQCNDALNKIQEAIVHYTKLSKLNCGKSADEANLKLGLLYLKNKQTQEAKIAFEKAKQSKYSEIAEQAKKELEQL